MMSEVQNTPAAAATAAPAADAAQTEAEVITAAVQNALAAHPIAPSPAPTLTAAQKTATAQGIYLAWRNNHLGGLPTSAFAHVETASADLISAIAAAL